jgi:hypothetical protein
MPKVKKSRHFNEPQCGVSRAVIEFECKSVGREMENYLLLALAETKTMMAERLRSYEQADASLHEVVQRLPEREQVAVKCLIARDLHLVVELYLEYLRPRCSESPAPAPIIQAQSAPTPFSEWLFGG